jgi:thioredoxin-like negative regulator of GroEL
MIEAALAAQLASLLAPFLPKLMETTTAAGMKALDNLAGKAGEAAWNKAVSVWNMLRPEVEKEPEVAKAIQDVAQNAEDPDAKVALAWQLKKLTLPPATLEEILKIVEESKSDIRITTADRGGVAIGGNVSGGTITAGYHSTDNKSEQ